MMNYTRRFEYLLAKYLEDKLSPEESEEFFGYVSTGDFDDVLEERIDHTLIEKGAEQSARLSDEASDHILQQIMGAAKETPVAPVKKRGARYRLLSLAAIVLSVAVGVWTIIFDSRVSEKSFAFSFKKDNPETIMNTSDTILTVILPDASTILLQPNSSISYSTSLFAGKRQVYMEGEARFQVTKNPANPFYVYYHDVVTKVLGTSFKIGTNKASGSIEVSVFTGKVQVYENGSIHRGASSSQGVIVTPNQKAIYKAGEREFKASLVDKPVEIDADSVANDGASLASRTFQFANTSLQQVFQKMEERYDVKIVVENDNIYNCVFSGDLSTPDFFDKLKIICLATNSNFEINETKVFIKGAGCK